MRRLAFLCFVLLIFVWGCAGDSSSLMSVWNDGGPGGSLGGQGGQTVPSAGGAGGGVVGGGSVAVQGGTRDLATTQCTSASSGGCAVSGAYLDCLQSYCGTSLQQCYYSDGVSAAAGGKCQVYANCMLGCPCHSGQKACQDLCLENYGITDSSCLMCLGTLFSCASSNGCTLPAACANTAIGW